MDWRACLRVGAAAAWATDRGEPIVQAMLVHLRANGVLLPGAAVLERIGLAARARARKKTFEAIASGMSEQERGTLTGLLSVDPELRRSRFAWLRDYSESPAPSNIVALLDRLEYARGLGVEHVFTFAAMATQMHPGHDARVFGAATDEETLVELKRAGLEILEDGHIGGLNGVLLGGALTSALSWSWIFFINVPVGLAVLAVSPVLLKESRADPDHRHFDAAGATSITGGLMLLVYALTHASQHGWATTETIGRRRQSPRRASELSRSSGNSTAWKPRF